MITKGDIARFIDLQFMLVDNNLKITDYDDDVNIEITYCDSKNDIYRKWFETRDAIDFIDAIIVSEFNEVVIRAGLKG